MKYVLDSSVAIKWVLPEPDVAKALALRDDYGRSIHELLAPDILPIEVAHALTRAERRRILQPPEALLRLRNVLSTAPYLHSTIPLLQRATELSSQMRIGVYDCLYLALAEREQCELVTADQRLIAIGHPNVKLLASLP